MCEPVGLRGEAADGAARHTLGVVQDDDVNYYVLVPFTTAAAALWAQGEIDWFDSHVVSAAAVDQGALVITDEASRCG